MRLSPPDGFVALLRWRFSPLLARLLLAAPFFVGACARLDDWRGAVAEASAAGVPAAPLAVGVAILAQATGALLLVSRRLTWLGAVLLGAVTAAAAVAGTPIWSLPTLGPVHDLLVVAATGAIVGALALAAIQAEPPD
ncbi:DoxX family membrane protein [Caulobacter sp. KR2-114]|uniref:DoxX family membrane protein n=1 Tax=Caulobacter sp. KR2-114 TaxID=3400912 RepID=UPI003C035F77